MPSLLVLFALVGSVSAQRAGSGDDAGATCSCTFPFGTSVTFNADDGSTYDVPMRHYGCQDNSEPTDYYNFAVDPEPWCEYHFDTDGDGANDVNGWGYCGDAGADADAVFGDIDGCASGLDRRGKTSVEACGGCAALAALVGGEFNGACVNDYGDGYYCDTYNTLKDRNQRDPADEFYAWMYCGSPTDAEPNTYTDEYLVSGYGCSVDGEPEYGALPEAPAHDEEDHHEEEEEAHDDHDGHDHGDGHDEEEEEHNDDTGVCSGVENGNECSDGGWNWCCDKDSNYPGCGDSWGFCEHKSAKKTAKKVAMGLIIGVVVAALAVVGGIIACCFCCAGCPGYKSRHPQGAKGAPPCVEDQPTAVVETSAK